LSDHNVAQPLDLYRSGYPAQALQQSTAACTLAHELSYPFGVATAQVYAALLHQLRRESPLAQEWAEAGITLAREHGFPAWLGHGTILQGWARAEQGQSEGGMSQLRQGLAIYQAMGAGHLNSYHLVLLAEVYGKAGQAEEGLAVLAEALAVVDRSGERFYEAELCRLKGQLTLQKGAKDWGLGTGSASPQAPSPKPLAPSGVEQEAEECFQNAIEIARKQQAKSLELRAVISLARLWKQQGKRKQARNLLAEVYGWFTEGFDTKDLQEAKELLAELSD
jgi:predicted ATPase